MTSPAFDEPATLLINNTRDEYLRRVMRELQAGGHIRTAADIGCGYGFFTRTLLELGLDVTAIDGRAEGVTDFLAF